MKNSIPGTPEQRAIQAVTREFSATLLGAVRPSGVNMTVRGRSIVLDVTLMSRGLHAPGRRAKQGVRVRLREDRVAVRVLHDLESALNPHLQDGSTIVLTLGAPIRLASKLVATLTETLVNHLASGATEADISLTMLGNRVRFRILKAGTRWAPQLIGFVFSGDPGPALLARTLDSLHEAIANSGGARRRMKSAGARWLALVVEDWIADIKTYRRAWSKLAAAHDYQRILMVSTSGQVEILMGER